MPHENRASVRVRSYEIDSYGHVNNAVYVSWLEHGRCCFLMDKGFDYHNIVEAWGVRFVTVNVSVNFKAGLELGEEAEVETRVQATGRSSVTFAQPIYRLRPDGQRELVVEATTVIVFTDPQMHASVPVPEEFRRLFVADAGS